MIWLMVEKWQGGNYCDPPLPLASSCQISHLGTLQQDWWWHASRPENVLSLPAYKNISG